MQTILVYLSLTVLTAANLAFAQTIDGDYFGPGAGGFEGAPGSSNGGTNYEKKFAHNWEPLFYLDFDFSNTITNLNIPNTQQKSNKTQGYRVVNSGRLEFGGGPRVEWFYENSTGIREDLWYTVGLVPIVGTGAVEVRYVPTLEEARNRNQPVQPVQSLEEIRSWAIGDSVTHMSKGGVLALAGVGAGWAGLSGTIVAQGTWSVYVERASENEVVVKLTRSEINHLAQAVGTIVTNISVSQFSSADKGFSFKVDLSHPNSPSVFSDLIRGNLAVAQKLAEADSPGVKFARVEDEIRNGNFRNFFLGIPLLAYARWSKGNITSLSKRDLKIEGATAEAQYGIYSRQHRTLFFGQSKWRSQSFYGARYSVLTNSDKLNSSGYFGKYSWILSDSDSNHWRLSEALKDLVRKTGVVQTLVAVPEAEKLENAAFNFEMHLNKELTDRLIESAQTMSKSEFVQIGMNLHREYFSRIGDLENDPYDVCSDFGWNLEYCREGTKDDVQDGLRQMWSALREMQNMKHDTKSFTRAYAKFGEGLSKNAFTFQAGLTLIGAGATIDLDFSGTHIMPFGLGFVTTDRPGELRLVRKGPSPAQSPNLEFPGTNTRGLIFGPGESGPPAMVPVMPPVPYY